MRTAWSRELWFQVRWALPTWLAKLVTSWWPDNRVTIRLRGLLYRPFLGSCGRNLQLAGGVTLLNGHNIHIGDNVYLSYYSWLNGLGGLYLEDEVVIGPFVSISTLTHCYHKGSFRFGGAKAAAVRVGRGSWLASHVSVNSGVTIGRGCLVGANAAVTRDVPDGTFAAGVPAIPIRQCREEDPTLLSRSGF